MTLRFNMVLGATLALAAIHNARYAAGEQQPEIRRLPPLEVAAAMPESEHAAGEQSDSVVDDTDQSVESGLSQAEIEAVEAQVLDELEAERSWYDWLVPSYLQLPVNWDSSFELGIDGSEGNASTLTFRSGADIRRKEDWSDLRIGLDYVKSTAERLETKHNAQLDANHDWLLGETPWSLFAKTILVYDEFRPFDLELTLNSGVGYQFIDTDVWKFKGRFGSGAVRQWDGPDDSWRPEAMLGLDFEYVISCRQKLHVKCDYFPDWTDFDVFRVRTDAGWELLLDQATNMSLKLGLIDRYDSNDGGTKPNALDYSLLLLWKL